MSTRHPYDYPHDWNVDRLETARGEHLVAMAAHRVEPLPAAVVCGHALEVLALSERIAREVLAGRWVYATEALAAGASVAEVASAVGLDESEVRQGLGRWVDSQVRYGVMTPARRAEVLALVGGDRS